jgi:hypothetical protein
MNCQNLLTCYDVLFNPECGILGAATYDAARGLVYAAEQEAGPDGQLAVHVWKVKTRVAYVSPSGCAGNTPCFAAPQDAIDDSEAGTTIKIAEGNYPPNVRVNKGVTLEMTWDQSFTTLDQPDPVVIGPDIAGP